MRESQALFQKMIPESEALIPIFRGANLRKKPYGFVSEDGQDCLCNIYSAEMDESACRFGLLHSPTPRFPREFLDGLGTAVVMNAGFMYTVDGSPIWPENFTYHLQVTGGKLIGLPTKTKYAVVSRGGRLRPELVEARGRLRVGDAEIPWVGCHEPAAKSAEKNGLAVAFGPSSQGLVKTSLGILPDSGRLLIEPREGCKFAVFGLTDDPTARLIDITERPVPHLAGAFTLRLPGNLAADLKLGRPVSDWQAGNLTPTNAEDAVTAGILLSPSPDEIDRRRAADRITVTRGVDGKPYFGDKDSQKGRTCVFRTTDGLVHFLIVDARPKVPGQQGMTLRELAGFLYASYDIDWVLSLDGGQSSKICWTADGSGGVCGNLHYINLNSLNPHWDGVNGRPVTSCVAAEPA